MSTVLPNHVLRLMSPADRAKLGPGGVTSEEAMAKCQARNEKQLQNLIVQYLHLRGVRRVVRSAMHRKTTTPVGTPDLLFCFNGKPFAFECKHGAGVISDEQNKALLDFGYDGWNEYVVRSVDDVRMILDKV